MVRTASVVVLVGMWSTSVTAGPAEGAPAKRVYHAGFTLLGVPDGAGKEVTVAFWYPASRRGAPCEYTLVAQKIEGRATRDAPAIPGRFPLVVYSHGGGGCGTNGATLAEHLAAHGFVVAAPDHHDEFVSARSDGHVVRDPKKIREYLLWAHRASKRKGTGRMKPSFYEHRPREIRATIDAVLGHSADPKSPWHHLVDPARIGITGVSFGAWTTVACAGGIPLYHDRRIKAAAPIAGQASRRGPFGISRLRVPVMIVFGELETIVLGDETSGRKTAGMQRNYERAHAPRFLVGIQGARHLHFGAAGAAVRGIRRLRTTDVADDDPCMAPTCHYVLAFFQRYLNGDRRAEQVLLRKDDRLFLHKTDLGNRGGGPGTHHKSRDITDQTLVTRWRDRCVSVAQVESGSKSLKGSARWAAFRAKIRPGDELWHFCSPGPTWQNMVGWEGYAIFRGNELVDTFTIREN